jgi:predicted YcjX-like family ATPase
LNIVYWPLRGTTHPFRSSEEKNRIYSSRGESRVHLSAKLLIKRPRELADVVSDFHYVHFAYYDKLMLACISYNLSSVTKLDYIHLHSVARVAAHIRAVTSREGLWQIQEEDVKN